MKIEEQVLSREQMAYLRELSVDTSDASMYWIRAERMEGFKKHNILDNDLGEWRLSLSRNLVIPVTWKVEYIPTYTIGDLIEKLPKTLRSKMSFSRLVLSTDGCDDPLYSAYYEFEYGDIAGKQTGDTSIGAWYKLLCWVAENHKELIK